MRETSVQNPDISLREAVFGTISSKRRRWWPRSRTVSFAEDRFLPIYEYFRVTGANDSVENYADLFIVVLRNDDIQEFDSKWDGIL